MRGNALSPHQADSRPHRVVLEASARRRVVEAAPVLYFTPFVRAPRPISKLALIVEVLFLLELVIGDRISTSILEGPALGRGLPRDHMTH